MLCSYATQLLLGDADLMRMKALLAKKKGNPDESCIWKGKLQWINEGCAGRKIRWIQNRRDESAKALYWANVSFSMQMELDSEMWSQRRSKCSRLSSLECFWNCCWHCCNRSGQGTIDLNCIWWELIPTSYSVDVRRWITGNDFHPQPSALLWCTIYAFFPTHLIFSMKHRLLGSHQSDMHHGNHSSSWCEKPPLMLSILNQLATFLLLKTSFWMPFRCSDWNSWKRPTSRQGRKYHGLRVDILLSELRVNSRGRSDWWARWSGVVLFLKLFFQVTVLKMPRKKLGDSLFTKRSEVCGKFDILARFFSSSHFQEVTDVTQVLVLKCLYRSPKVCAILWGDSFFFALSLSLKHLLYFNWLMESRQRSFCTKIWLGSKLKSLDT